MVELAFLKVLMLIKKVHVESVLFATNCFFSYKGFNFQPALLIIIALLIELAKAMP